MAKTIRIDYEEITKGWSLTDFRPEGFRWWAFKLQVAFLLLRLAAWISGMNFIVADNEKESEDG